MNSPVAKLNKSDVEICRAFKAIVKDANFDVKGEALSKLGALFRWFEELDKRIEETVKAPPAPPIIRDLSPQEIADGKADIAKKRGKK